MLRLRTSEIFWGTKITFFCYDNDCRAYIGTDRLELSTSRLSNEHSTIELQVRTSFRGACVFALSDCTFVGAEGIEPSMPDPKTGALPLGYAPGQGKRESNPPL